MSGDWDFPSISWAGSDVSRVSGQGLVKLRFFGGRFYIVCAQRGRELHFQVWVCLLERRRYKGSSKLLGLVPVCMGALVQFGWEMCPGMEDGDLLLTFRTRAPVGKCLHSAVEC